MSDLIDREHVIDFLKLTRDSEYEKSMSAEVKHKSVIRSKHDAHVAFCDYLIEYVNQVPTHPTPSNTLGALDCVSREDLTKGIETYFGDLPITVHYDMLALAQNLPSVQPKQKWETCFDCPLSHGCPKINGCTNRQTMEYASEVPDDCPISAQPRKGKWIDDGTEFGCCCSECNYTLDDYFYGELREVALTKLMNFCHNCGADMRGEQNEL